MKEPRIFIGVTEVAGYFQNLFLGFKKLGYDAGYLNVQAFSFAYNAYKSENYPLLNTLITTAEKANGKESNTFFAFLNKLIYLALKAYVFCWCIFKFDVFIFATGSAFFRFADYRILKIFNKQIIHVSLGSDSRPGYLNGAYKDDTAKGNFDPDQVLMYDNVIVRKIKIIEKYADVIINYPQHAHFHERSFISGNFIGFPTVFKPSGLNVSAGSDGFEPVKILHAPTRPKAKGSVQFRAIIDELKSEGLQIDYREITGKTNLQVIEEIENTDIVLDELYSDLALGGLGSEAACLGKPVVVGGYYAQHLATETLKEDTPPSFYCHPSEIKAALRKLVLDKSFREKSGRGLQNFLSKHWKNEMIASKYLKIIKKDYPPFWMMRPEEIDYLYGWGLSEEEARNNISLLLKTHGENSLRLGHNPELLNRFVNMVSAKVYA